MALSKARIDTLDTMTEAWHASECMRDAKPGMAWSDEHMRADRRAVRRFADALHVRGHVVVPASNTARMPVDYLAVP